MKNGTTLSFLCAGAALAAFGVSALLVNVFERKQESRTPYFRVAGITESTGEPAIWGRNFPLQYESYLRTKEQQPTRFGGSLAVMRAPTPADPRNVTAQDKIAADPRLKVIWAGYAFATDFREERGHAYMLEDQRYTRRVLEYEQPGACLNCHTSAYTIYRMLGNGDIFAGFDRLNSMPYAEAVKLARHPVACLDCHEPQTMRLRVTRPAFIEGMRALKASQGASGYDVNRDASPQEMRSFVCGQCHVEYYFKGGGKRLTFPWSKGLRLENALAVYDEAGFHDWIHPETGAPVLKAQHPEFEMFSQGLHARSGVACADCHMPYRREGAVKVSDHQVRSPLLNINAACQGCHHSSEGELKQRVETIQARFTAALDIAMDALVELIGDIRAARDAGAGGSELAASRSFQRKAQFYIDYVGAENSTGFHASGEALRILTEAMDAIRRGQIALRSSGNRFPSRPQPAPGRR